MTDFSIRSQRPLGPSNESSNVKANQAALFTLPKTIQPSAQQMDVKTMCTEKLSQGLPAKVPDELVAAFIQDGILGEGLGSNFQKLVEAFVEDIKENHDSTLGPLNEEKVRNQLFNNAGLLLERFSAGYQTLLRELEK